MSGKHDRRTFLKTGVLLGSGIILNNSASNLFAKSINYFNNNKSDLAVVTGNDYYASTIKAVDALGGMKKIIGNNSSVGILVNSRYNKPGTYVKPEIVIAVMGMCFSAGAKKIISLENVTASYWRLNNFSKKHAEIVDAVKNAGNNYKKVKIPHGTALTEAEVEKDFLDCDVYINIPIFKQHEGIRITGCLKNLMGLTSNTTNRYFHFGSNASDWYSDITHLSQCIADINLLRKPDLCIADAIEYITTNGPFGPGNVVKAKKIAAGKDIVAVDSMGAKILGYEPSDIIPIKLAAKNGLGEIDPAKVKVKEISV